VDDLREAGIAPALVAMHADGPKEQALASLYRRYVELLSEARARGLVDVAALMADAAEWATSFASRFAAVVHHGAYELIGAHLDLVRAIDRGREVSLLLPCEPGAPVFERAERFAIEHLLREGAAIERLPDRAGGLLGARVATLYDEEKRPAPAPEGSIRTRHAQGALAEVTAALRSAVSSAEAGVPASEVGIVARTLQPYAVAIEAAFEEDPRIPWTSSLEAPLRRDPRVRDLLGVLRVVADDFPRARTAELLRSPHIAWDVILDGARPRLDLAEYYSRRAGIVSGLAEWRELPTWASVPLIREDDGEEERALKLERAVTRGRRAKGIVRAIEALAARTGKAAPATWSRHAKRVREMALDLSTDARMDESPPVRAFLEHVRGMADAEALLGDTREVPFGEMVDWLERAVSGDTTQDRTLDDGGFRVLDAMQARGLTFRSVLLLGFHAGLVPREPREDPFLPDPLRLRLARASGRPLGIKSEGESEERLLLALLLGSAKESIHVSWQRADEAGRLKSASLALREVSRLALGRPDLDALLTRAGRVSTHPATAVDDLLESTGLLTAREEMLLLALRGGGAGLERALLERESGMAHGLAMMRATESFGLADGTFDGRVGPGVLALEKVSVTAMERLGRCPLQFFFHHRLGIQDLEVEADTFDLTIREWGVHLHRVLERTYRALAAEGLGASEEMLVERADAALAIAWEETFRGVAERIVHRFPALWAVSTARHREALRAFVRSDLLRIQREGGVLRAFEDARRMAMEIAGAPVVIEGRFDRVRETGDVVTVGDYKTWGKLKRRGDPAKMLKGETLQVPLYQLLAGGAGRVELLGVGPEYDPELPLEDSDRGVQFRGFKTPALADGFRETIHELLSLAREGVFPLYAEFHCGWCEYRRACRRMHPPTQHREASWRDSEAFRYLHEKNTRKPMLADVRTPPAAGEDEDPS
jgi:RecB family exonuclease